MEDFNLGIMKFFKPVDFIHTFKNEKPSIFIIFKFRSFSNLQFPQMEDFYFRQIQILKLSHFLSQWILYFQKPSLQFL